MPRRYYSSTAARTTLASGVNNSTTTFSVTAVSGWPTSFPYTLVIDQDTVNEEIVEVTARSGTTLTVVRGRDGTAAVAHSAGAAVNHGVSARDFDEPNAFINGTGVVTETLLATNSVSAAKIVDGTITDAKIGASAAIAQSKISNLTSDLASKVDYATPTNAQSGTGASAYTFVLADAQRLTTATGTSAKTFTIPPQASVAWVANSIIRVANYGTGALTIAGGSGVTVTNTATTIGQYEAAAAIRTGSNAWTLVPFGGGSNPPTSVEYLIVAGGGGGSGPQGYAGGGAGGLLSGTFTISPTSYTITVGGGGSGTSTGGAKGANGTDSSAFGFTATGGGGGGGGWTGSGNGTAAGNGGSGGGGGARFTAGGASGTASGGTGTSGQGKDGGLGAPASGTVSALNAGGGGGAGAAGGAGSNVAGAGAGGNGSEWPTGSGVFYAGGGGGAGQLSNANGGSGGGGNGATSASNNGTANTGGGGGGSLNSAGGNGGSGVVVIRHLDVYKQAVTSGSPTITTSGGFITYTFTGSGTIEWAA